MQDKLLHFLLFEWLRMNSFASSGSLGTREEKKRRKCRRVQDSISVNPRIKTKATIATKTALINKRTTKNTKK